MKKFMAEIYETHDRKFRFVKGVEGGWVAFIPADGLSIAGKNLADWPGVNVPLAAAYAELTEFLQRQENKP